MTEFERMVKEDETYEEDRETVLKDSIYYIAWGIQWDEEKGEYRGELADPHNFVDSLHAVCMENRGLVGVLGINSKILAESNVQHAGCDSEYGEEMIPAYDGPVDERIYGQGAYPNGMTVEEPAYIELFLISDEMKKTNKKFAFMSNLISGNNIEIDSTKNVPVVMLTRIVDILRENGYDASVENKYTVFDKIDTYNTDVDAFRDKTKYSKYFDERNVPKELYEFDGIMINVGDEIVDDVDKLYEVGEKINKIIKEYY